MKKENVSVRAAKGAASILNKVLKADANSTSCMVIYQPKAPEELARFRRHK